MPPPSPTLRHLTSGHLGAMHATFTASFSDYALPAHRSLAELEALMIRRGIRYDLSVGAFDGDEMAAVMAVGLGRWEGRSAAYDIYTGVRSDHRGRGLAGRLFDFARPALAALGVELFLLEVLQVNEPAIRAYRRAGFRASRELVCFELASDAVARLAAAAVRPGADGVEWAFGEGAVGPAHQALWSGAPSWQNDSASMARMVDRRRLLEARCRGELLAYGVLLPDLGDLPQLAVHPEHRRRGLGTALLGRLCRTMPANRPLKVLNVAGDAARDLAFFTSVGGREYTRQWEMLLEV